MALARLSGNDVPEMLHVPVSRHVRSGGNSPESSQSLGVVHSPTASPRGSSARAWLQFRNSLVASHAQLLKQLDERIRDVVEMPSGEMGKEATGSGSLMVKEPSIKRQESGSLLTHEYNKDHLAPPRAGDSSWPLEPRDQPRMLDTGLGRTGSKTAVPFVATITAKRLPAVMSSESGLEDVTSDDEQKGDDPVTKTLTCQITETFATLTDMDEKRKKNMVWIQKNPRMSTFQEVCDEFSPRISSALSRKQKQAATEDAQKRFGETGAFVHFTPEHVESVVHRAAFAKFEKDVEAEADDAKTSRNCCARIVAHRWFERLALLLTLSNLIYISIDIEFNYSGLVTRASPGFTAADNLFCSLFLTELIIRLFAYPRYIMAVKDTTFLFDTVLVVMMVLESWLLPLIKFIAAAGTQSDVAETTSVLRIARVMRILRTARIAKLVRYVPELVILLKGMLTACRSVFFTLLLLLLVTYVFSITITEVSRGTNLEDELFSGMWNTILTLIVQCVMPDLETKFKAAALENWFVGLLWLLFIMFGTYIVMGLLVGILVETVKTVATFERKQLEIDFAQNVLWELITETCADQDGDNKISQTEFVQLMGRPEASKALTALGVDPVAALDYGHLLFEDGEPLTFAEFMEGMMTLRGTNQTTVKDMVDLRKFAAEEFSNLHAVLLEICTFLQSQGMTIDSLKTVRYSRASRMTQRQR